MDLNVIGKILTRMSRLLNCSQLKELRCVLETIEDNDEQEEIESNSLLTRFIDAKKVEGCSHTTLEYYRATLQRMIDNINRRLSAITADDLRCYLRNYIETNKVSKVTVDNVRRILSTFFSWLENEDYIVKSPVRRIRRIKTPSVIKETPSIKF